MRPAKRNLLYLMAAFYAAAGINHFLNPAFYLLIIPPELPRPEWINVIAGLAEIVLGVCVLLTRVRVLAAWGVIALLVAVFPANIYMATENLGLPGGEPGTGSPLFNWGRLPLQGVLILWAWWYTQPDPD